MLLVRRASHKPSSNFLYISRTTCDQQTMELRSRRHSEPFVTCIRPIVQTLAPARTHPLPTLHLPRNHIPRCHQSSSRAGGGTPQLSHQSLPLRTAGNAPTARTSNAIAARPTSNATLRRIHSEHASRRGSAVESPSRTRSSSDCRPSSYVTRLYSTSVG